MMKMSKNKLWFYEYFNSKWLIIAQQSQFLLLQYINRNQIFSNFSFIEKLDLLENLMLSWVWSS